MVDLESAGVSLPVSVPQLPVLPSPLAPLFLYSSHLLKLLVFLLPDVVLSGSLRLSPLPPSVVCPLTRRHHTDVIIMMSSTQCLRTDIVIAMC